MDTPVSSAPFLSVPPRTMYEIFRLRIDVFIVEQNCPYAELDGRDTEPTTVHWWVSDAETVVATCRLLRDATTDDHVLGRVATTPSVRGGTVASTMVEAALGSTIGSVRIGAQAPLEAWYGRFGFVRTGPNYIEDGIAHLPMRLDR